MESSNKIDNGEIAEKLFSEFNDSASSLDFVDVSDFENLEISTEQKKESSFFDTEIKTETSNSTSSVIETAQESEPLKNGTLQDFFTKKSAVDMFDVVFSRVATLGIRQFSNKKVVVDDFKLKPDEKEVLKDPLYRVLGEIRMDLENPYSALAFAMFTIYGVKLMEIFSGNNEIEATTKAERKKEGTLPNVPRGTSTGSVYVAKWKRGSDGKLLKDANGNKIANNG